MEGLEGVGRPARGGPGVVLKSADLFVYLQPELKTSGFYYV